MAAFIAEHNLPFTVMEHLPDLIKNMCTDSDIAKGLACSRTKTTAIVTNVIGSKEFQDVCEDLRQNKFSLIVDESTDIGTIKHLCVVVRYSKNNTIKDNFFSLIPLSRADSQTLYDVIVDLFNSNNIPYKNNLIGFAADGANVMMGKQNSLMTRLKNDVPHLCVVKCICHSFHLCASYASQKIPRFVEDITRDIHNYFNSSPKRTSELQEFQNFCNVKKHKILHPSQTRWLSVQSVVSRILEQYGALKLYFIDAVSQGDVLAAEQILNRLRDPTTKLFLQFLDFALPFFNILNKDMQAESPRIHVLYKNVSNVVRSIFDCFLKRNYLTSVPLENIDYKDPRNFLPIEEFYFGANVAKTFLESDVTLTNEQIHFFRIRCLEFYIESCDQILTRFPLKNNPVKLFNFLDPVTVKSGSISSITDVANIFPNLIEDQHLQTLDNEWRFLRNTDSVKNLSDQIEIFWQKVSQYRLGDNQPMFPILSQFSLNLLCLPHSSANVERRFSEINLMKTKQRNSLGTKTVRGLVYTRQYLGSDKCFNFTVSNELISNMNNKTLKGMDENL